MLVKSFTVFGLQRTGTNFTHQLVINNFQNLNLNQSQYVWKHEPNTDLVYNLYKKQKRENHAHILVSKNPYKWVESILRNPVDIKIRRPRVLYNLDALSQDHVLEISSSTQNKMAKAWKIEKINLVELIKLYNEFYNNWINLQPKIKNWSLTKYETLLDLENCLQFVESLSQKYKWNIIKHSHLIIPAHVTLSENWTLSLRKKKIQDYWNSDCIKTLTQDQVNVIDKHLDKSLLEKLGYSTNKPISDLS
jgi:uncharacterized phage-associated protein